MEFTAEQIAHFIQAQIEGNAQATVNTFCKIEEGAPGGLSFLSNPAYEEYVYSTASSICIVNDSFVPAQPLPEGLTLLKVKDARLAFAQLLTVYNQAQLDAQVGIQQPAFVDESAQLGEKVFVGPFTTIGKNVQIGGGTKIMAHVTIEDNCVIGENTIIKSNVTVHKECVIGNHCTIYSGVVIGGDGFGFAPNAENQYNKVPHIGNVVIKDHVEIGSNTTIDRATIGSTIIEKGVKLDNLIQIGHNVVIGENTVIAAQTGVAGSAKIGKNCMIGGQVGIVGHISIADGVKIAAQSGIGSTIKKEGEIVQGSPAFNIGEYKRSYVKFRNLPKILSNLEK